MLGLGDGCLLLLAAGGLLARYVAPDVLWWLQPLGIVLPLLMVMVLLAGLAAWLLVRRPGLRAAVVLMHAVCVLFFAVRLDPPRLLPQSEVTPAGDAPVLRVFTWNCKLHDAASERDILRALLSQTGADVVALQETRVALSQDLDAVIAGPAVQRVLQSQSYRLVDLQPGQETNLPVLTRRPAGLAVAADELVTAPGDPSGREARFVRRVLVEWQGRRIAVYNVHLHSYGPEGRRGRIREMLQKWHDVAAWQALVASYRYDYVTRAAEARQLRRLLRDETHPFIVVGDMNTTPHNWVYAHVVGVGRLGLLQDLFTPADVHSPRGSKDGALRDACSAYRRGCGGTYPAGAPLVRIDYVLASRHWRVDAAEVVPAAYSDHRPVTAKLVLDVSR